MWTILGTRNAYCDGISRRNFLKIGAFGGGLSLADLLRGRELASAGSIAPPNKSVICSTKAN